MRVKREPVGRFLEFEAKKKGILTGYPHLNYERKEVTNAFGAYTLWREGYNRIA